MFSLFSFLCKNLHLPKIKKYYNLGEILNLLACNSLFSKLSATGVFNFIRHTFLDFDNNKNYKLTLFNFVILFKTEDIFVVDWASFLLRFSGNLSNFDSIALLFFRKAEFDFKCSLILSICE